MTTTASLIRTATSDTGEWQPAPAPKNGPFPIFVRTTPEHSPVLHMDNWLLDAIHGKTYEWCEIEK